MEIKLRVGGTICAIRYNTDSKIINKSVTRSIKILIRDLYLHYILFICQKHNCKTKSGTSAHLYMSSHFVAVGSVWGSHTYYGVSVQRVKYIHSKQKEFL